MNDYKGLLLFALGILDGASLLQRNPRYVNDEREVLSDRWGCDTLGQLKEKIREELNKEIDHA